MCKRARPTLATTDFGHGQLWAFLRMRRGTNPEKGWGFSLSRHKIRSSLSGSSRGILLVLKRRGAQTGDATHGQVDPGDALEEHLLHVVSGFNALAPLVISSIPLGSTPPLFHTATSVLRGALSKGGRFSGADNSPIWVTITTRPPRVNIVILMSPPTD